MDAGDATDWRGLAANLANAAHRLKLTVVNLASDPSVPELVRRSPAFVAATRNAELVDAFLERWREAERVGRSMDVVVDLAVAFAVGSPHATVTPRTDAGLAWLRSTSFHASQRLGGALSVDVGVVDQLISDAEASGLVVEEI